MTIDKSTKLKSYSHL